MIVLVVWTTEQILDPLAHITSLAEEGAFTMVSDGNITCFSVSSFIKSIINAVPTIETLRAPAADLSDSSVCQGQQLILAKSELLLPTYWRHCCSFVDTYLRNFLCVTAFIHTS